MLLKTLNLRKKILTFFDIFFSWHNETNINYKVCNTCQSNNFKFKQLNLHVKYKWKCISIFKQLKKWSVPVAQW